MTLSTESHVFSVAGLFTLVGIFEPVLWPRRMSGRAVKKDSASKDLSSGLPTVPALFILNPVSDDSNLDKFKSTQNATLRFTKIPWTVLFADLRLSQEQIGEFQEQTGEGAEPFNRGADSDTPLQDIRTGFNTSPWTWLSLNAQHHYTSSDTTYNNALDAALLPGYPSFILARQIVTHDFETKMILHPAPWLHTTLSYDIVTTDYNTETEPVPGGISPGGPLTDGIYDSRDYGLNVTLTPWRSLYFSGALTYGKSMTLTADNSDPSIVPYKGHVYTLTASAGYAFSKSVSLNLAYSFSEANYDEHSAADGVPLGLDFTRNNLTCRIRKQINARVAATLSYIYSSYKEPGSGGFNDYNSQGVFATLSYAWP